MKCWFFLFFFLAKCHPIFCKSNCELPHPLCREGHRGTSSLTATLGHFISPCIRTSSRRGRFGNCSFMEKHSFMSETQPIKCLFSSFEMDYKVHCLLWLLNVEQSKRQAKLGSVACSYIEQASEAFLCQKSTWITRGYEMEALRFVTCENMGILHTSVSMKHWQ